MFRLAFDDLRRFDTPNEIDFFDDNDCRESGAFLGHHGDLRHRGSLEQAAADRWLAELAGFGQVSLLAVNGSLVVGGDIELDGPRARFHGLLVTGDLYARNVVAGANAHLLVLGRTELTGALFIDRLERGAQFQGPLAAETIVGDPEEHPVHWGRLERARIVDTLEGQADVDGPDPHLPLDSRCPPFPSPSFVTQEARRLLTLGDEAGAFDTMASIANVESPRDPWVRANLAGVSLMSDLPRAARLAATVEEGAEGDALARGVHQLAVALVDLDAALSDAPPEAHAEAVAAYQRGAEALGAGDVFGAARAWLDSLTLSREPGEDLARKSLLVLIELLRGHPRADALQRELMLAL